MWSESGMQQRVRLSIEANIVNLSKTTKNLSSILLHFEQTEILDLYDLSLIEKMSTNSEKCYKFYEIILEKDISSFLFKSLLEIFDKTDNKAIIPILLSTKYAAASNLQKRLSFKKSDLKKSQRDFTVSKEEEQQSFINSVIGIFIIGFTTSIPLFLFLFMVKSYFDQLNNNA